MIVTQMRTAMIQAKKDRNSVRSLVLSTLIGEMMASAIVKDGEKVVTDKVATAVLKKAKKNLEENMEKGYGSIDAHSNELKVVEEFIPAEVALMGEDETRAAIEAAKASGASDMKSIMGYLKTNHEGRFDGKIASKLAKEAI